MNHKKSIIIFALFICFFVIGANKAQANGAPIPVISDFSPQIQESGRRLSVSGSITRGTEALIYIDGVYVKTLQIDFNDSENGAFSYVHEQSLSVGKHWLMVVAKDRTSLVLSPPSEQMLFEVKKGDVFSGFIPAPTMFFPVVNNKTTDFQPFVVGLSKNDTRIKVYIDEKLDGEFEVKNNESGTANFAYKPSYSLARGEHKVYAVAFRSGEESRQSEVISFKVSSPAIASGASEDNVKVKSAEIDYSNLNKLGSEEVEKDVPGAGSIDENKESSSQRKIQLIVVALVLAGAVLWFLWRKNWFRAEKIDSQAEGLTKDLK